MSHCRRLLAATSALALSTSLNVMAWQPPPAGPSTSSTRELRAPAEVLQPLPSTQDPGSAPFSRSSYTWPTGAIGVVVEGYDPPAVRWASGHRGADLSLAAGSPVRSAGEGAVAFAGDVAGRPVVSVDHPDGLRTTYEPVQASVSVGDPVGRGQVIGVLQAGHRSDGVDALHWGARRGPRTYVNPLRLISPATVRLKPLAPGAGG